MHYLDAKTNPMEHGEYNGISGARDLLMHLERVFHVVHQLDETLTAFDMAGSNKSGIRHSRHRLAEDSSYLSQTFHELRFAQCRSYFSRLSRYIPIPKSTSTSKIKSLIRQQMAL